MVDSRESREGDSIRRRRECIACNRRFTSYERVEEVPLFIVKKDGRREPFDREKLLKGMIAACQKRPVSLLQLQDTVVDIHAKLLEHNVGEFSSRELGELVMSALKQLDSVAYVRFASIYKEFKDLPDFVQALESLMVQSGLRSGRRASLVPPEPVETSVPMPSASATPLFPGLAPSRVGPAKRRKSR